MSEDSPKIVNLEPSLELSEFLSELDFPSEASVPPDGSDDAASGVSRADLPSTRRFRHRVQDEPTGAATPPLHFDESRRSKTDDEESARSSLTLKRPQIPMQTSTNLSARAHTQGQRP